MPFKHFQANILTLGASFRFHTVFRNSILGEASSSRISAVASAISIWYHVFTEYSSNFSPSHLRASGAPFGLGLSRIMRSSSKDSKAWMRFLFHSPKTSWMRSRTVNKAESLVVGPMGLMGEVRLNHGSSQIRSDAPSPTTKPKFSRSKSLLTSILYHPDAVLGGVQLRRLPFGQYLLSKSLPNNPSSCFSRRQLSLAKNTLLEAWISLITRPPLFFDRVIFSQAIQANFRSPLRSSQ